VNLGGLAVAAHAGGGRVRRRSDRLGQWRRDGSQDRRLYDRGRRDRLLGTRSVRRGLGDDDGLLDDDRRLGDEGHRHGRRHRLRREQAEGVDVAFGIGGDPDAEVHVRRRRDRVRALAREADGRTLLDHAPPQDARRRQL
jgi:hypothetical protein